MGRELTRRYPLLSEPLSLGNLRRLVSMAAVLAREIYRSGKIRELCSFAIWEARHRLGFFARDAYLRFSPDPPLSLTIEQPSDAGLEHSLRASLAPRGLRMLPSDRNWKLLFTDGDRVLFGCAYPDDRVLLRSADDGASVEEVARFPERIKAVFVSSRGLVVVATRGVVYQGRSDGSAAFAKAFDLSSPSSIVRHNNEITETREGTIIVGEYGNVWDDRRGWQSLAYLYMSGDDGASWERADFLVGVGTNKHVHVVRYSATLDCVLMADGDNRKKFWTSRGLVPSSLRARADWRLVNRFHVQGGGYTSVAEIGDRVLLGTDYQGGTNFVVETTDGDTYRKVVVPDPYRRSPIDNMRERRGRACTEVWANLPFSTARSRCLLMFTRDGREWHRVVDYDERTHKVWLLNSARSATRDVYVAIEHRGSNERRVWKVQDA